MRDDDDRGVPRIARRAVTLSALAVSAMAMLVLGPALVVCALVVDLARRSRFALTRALLMVVVYLAYEVAGVALATAIWIRGGDASRQRDANFRLQWWWAAGLFDATRALFGLRVETHDLHLAREGPVFVLARHASVGDTLLAAALLSRPHGLRLRYVLKRELLWDPCLDIVGWRLPNAFVRRGARDTGGDLLAVRALAEGLGAHDGVLIFPEGTRLTEQARLRALERLSASERSTTAQREVARSLVHVLPPRVEGVLSLLEADTQADVVFLAHTGFDGVRTLADLRGGALVGRRVVVRAWRCGRGEVPVDREGRVRWLMAQWARMDAVVGGTET